VSDDLPEQPRPAAAAPERATANLARETLAAALGDGEAVTLGGRVRPEQMFGKYRVVRDLNKGGMAQVFLAMLDGPDGFTKTCVIKRILPEYAKDPSFAQMFINEAKVAAMMSHPNIVQVFEFSKEKGEYFLSMEYVSGAPLDRVVRMARKVGLTLGPRVAVEVGIAVANALHYAHTFTRGDGTPLNIVHRDISPDNILVSREGVAKLADFGVVKSDLNTQVTTAGVVKGKWAYMSPQQVASLPVDHRSDIFSLGVILYEVCTGRRLFKGETLASTVTAVMKAEVPPPSRFVPDLSPRLERILLKALAREPKDRYQSASDFAADLEAFRASQSWTAGGRHLGSIVNTLFPKDGSQPGAQAAPGSGASVAGVASLTQTQEDLPLASAPQQAVEVDAPVSPALVLVLVVGAALSSLLFWYLVL
jgi:eukaryotic-like serine/threonine-protein kinase